MSQSAISLADQLRRSYAGEAWHGLSLSELLKDISAAQAAAFPIRGAHSIWEIVVHVSAWQTHILNRLKSTRAIQLSEEEDWPPVKVSSEAAWKVALTALKSSNEKLVALAAKLDDKTLFAQVPGKEYDNYFMLHGTIQHNLYHAGQIPLLKRAQAT